MIEEAPIWNPGDAFGRPVRVCRDLSKPTDCRPESAHANFLQTVRKLGLRDSRITGAILESGMAHISGFERDQLLLLPEAV
ncbi:MAG: hypothetical protein WBQ45_18555, partial [Roseiarcus sp.]|uniref:hypothetical protein n=1 Tax=Roseiarcus sp. TaxID=1969460 RepID=UPI003C587545